MSAETIIWVAAALAALVAVLALGHLITTEQRRRGLKDGRTTRPGDRHPMDGDHR